MSELDLAAIDAQLPSNARMEAYYYHFKRTGVGLVDAVLSAVAVAGKGAHHTETWAGGFDTEEYYQNWPGLPDGESAADLIQATADRSAYQVKVLINEIRRLRADLDAFRALAGPDNESGFISTDALIYTIGTGENRLTELQTQIERLRLDAKVEAFMDAQQIIAGEYALDEARDYDGSTASIGILIKEIDKEIRDLPLGGDGE